MSFEFDSVWGRSEEIVPTVVSARAETTEKDASDVATVPTATKLILDEIAKMQRDNARRNATTTMIVCLIGFAILLQMDRSQAQLRQEIAKGDARR